LRLQWHDSNQCFLQVVDFLFIGGDRLAVEALADGLGVALRLIHVADVLLLLLFLTASLVEGPLGQI